MPRKRTADDQVLSLLARLGRALECQEIAEMLGWSKQRAAAVLEEISPESLTVTEGPPRAMRGPRPKLYSLPGVEPAKPEPATPYFEPDTIVVTPSGREARVIAMRPGGFVELVYLAVRIGHDPGALVHAKLLRAFQPGRERPDPVRIIPDPSPA